MSRERKTLQPGLVRHSAKSRKVRRRPHFDVVNSLACESNHRSTGFRRIRTANSNAIYRLYGAFPFHTVDVALRLENLTRTLDSRANQFSALDRRSPHLN